MWKMLCIQIDVVCDNIIGNTKGSSQQLINQLKNSVVGLDEPLYTW